MKKNSLIKELKKMNDKLTPEIQAVVLAMILAAVRVVYDRKETHPIRVLLESLICGLLTKAFYHFTLAIEVSPDWAIVGGGMIGFLGTYTVRAFAIKILKREVK
jgi:lambda family phage holin